MSELLNGLDWAREGRVWRLNAIRNPYVPRIDITNGVPRPVGGPPQDCLHVLLVQQRLLQITVTWGMRDPPWALQVSVACADGKPPAEDVFRAVVGAAFHPEDAIVYVSRDFSPIRHALCLDAHTWPHEDPPWESLEPIQIVPAEKEGLPASRLAIVDLTSTNQALTDRPLLDGARR